jgi:hypothetical protein
MKKTKINVEVLADSITEDGIRLITARMTYWRSIHAELMTYREFSRCAASSRAIPVMTMLKAVLFDPAGPVHWGANQKGMQARSELQGWRRWLVEKIFYAARYPAVLMAWFLTQIGLHKQVANRILEPWMWMTTLVTSTSWDNILVQRYHPDAQPDFQVLAHRLLEALNGSTPRLLKEGQWHLPMVEQNDDQGPAALSNKLKLSVARAARTSYTTQEGKVPNWSDDMRIYDSLIAADPWHASPSEHQATPDCGQYGTMRLNGNFHHAWIQNRKLLEMNRKKPHFPGLFRFKVYGDTVYRSPLPDADDAHP